MLKIDLETMIKATNRRTFGLVQVDDNLINLQQGVADTYYKLKLIPKEINVKDAVLTKEEYAAFSPKT